MDAPWNHWAPRKGAHNAAARALAELGCRVVEHRDGGTGVEPLSEYLYDCGCRRVYVADLRRTTEREVHVPCKSHRNLLTPDGAQATMGLGPAGKAPGAAETT